MLVYRRTAADGGEGGRGQRAAAVIRSLVSLGSAKLELRNKRGLTPLGEAVGGGGMLVCTGFTLSSQLMRMGGGVGGWVWV